MRQLIKRLAYPFLSRWYQQSVRKMRSYSNFGLDLDIYPSVFHPRLFLSTEIFVSFVTRLPLLEKKVLELGAGSGLIAFVSQRAGAIVTATDINTQALQGLIANSEKNKAPITVLHSDLFENVKPEAFDFIFINPPYYAKDPSNEWEKAFYCGAHFDYFERLFAQLSSCEGSDFPVCYMILSQDCDLIQIMSRAKSASIELRACFDQTKLGERNTIYQITRL